MQFAGGLYTDGDRRVYFDGSDPTKPLMRVPQRGERGELGEGIVTSSYPWDRGDPLHMDTYKQDLRTRRVCSVTPHTLSYLELGSGWLDID